MIESLIEKGHAYAVDGNVYFAVQSFERYGTLSGNTLAKLEAGASGRVEEREEKRNPNDFALWKHDPKHLMQWDSPWGKGFPGWHIECSAMSRKYLGDTFDIHTGGPDNIFPHHECEIAQSESVTGETFVRYWVHVGWLTIGGDKMAKRAGKLYTVPELVEMGYEGPDIRLYMLKQHYRKPLPFDLELLDEAKRIRKRINNFVFYEMANRPEDFEKDAVKAEIEEARERFQAALSDDLNTSGALAVIHGFMTAVNKLEPSNADAALVVEFVREWDGVFAILDDEPEDDLDTAATRVWTALECLKKAGVGLHAPLVLLSSTQDGWVLLASGPLTLATLVVSVRHAQNPLAIATLTRGRDKASSLQIEAPSGCSSGTWCARDLPLA